MTYLVDANVLSEATKESPDPKVVAWLRTNEANLMVDAVIIGELRMGVLALPKSRKREKLEKWFEALVDTIDCLPWDADVSRRWDELVVELRRKGETVPLLDGMIAATALQHDLTVATRNIRDFKKTGAKTVNPFD
jgi:toxin FitB